MPTMRKTLILVVDRDDDFGSKAQVETPCIGIHSCTEAVNALGLADPEDSDVNALYAAMNIYRELELTEKAGSFEVALACGDKKVGYNSDRALASELDTIFNEVEPDAAILVGDGAEDEYVYPIVSSRVPIDSVRRVYVKQAPGVEGTFYIISKSLEDPQKRQRFVAPLGLTMTIVSLVYLISGYLSSGGWNVFAGESVTPLIFLTIGLLISAYGYSMNDRILRFYHYWSERAKQGSVTVMFLVASLIFLAFGLAIGASFVSEYYTETFSQKALVFIYHALWIIIFGYMLFLVGGLVDRYFNIKVVKYSTITNSLDIVAIGLVLTGLMDWMATYNNLFHTNDLVIATEVVAGLFLSAFAHVNHYRVTKTTKRKMVRTHGFRELGTDLRIDMRRHGL